MLAVHHADKAVFDGHVDATLGGRDHPRHGDMRQELVFIGQNLNQAAITHALDNCLLSDDELLAGKALWQTLPDPFPVWEEA